MIRQSFITGIALVAMAVAGTARAAVIDLRNVVSANPNLVHHYTFEGNTDIERREDKDPTGAWDLQNGSGTTNPGPVTYPTGFDSTTIGMKPSLGATANDGRALYYDGAFSVVRPITVEALIYIDPFDDGTPKHAIVAGSAGPGRGFFLSSREGALRLSMGSDPILDATRSIVPSDAFVKGNWYYVVSTYEAAGSDTRVNAYYANMTAGQTTLTHSLQDEIISGTYSTTEEGLGIGMLAIQINPPNRQFLNGILDEVAIYNTALSGTTLQGHYDALAIPEPTSAVLLTLSGLALLKRRRR